MLLLEVCEGEGVGTGGLAWAMLVGVVVAAGVVLLGMMAVVVYFVRTGKREEKKFLQIEIQVAQ